ncbi:hypothetical protein Bca4012_019485 [Brassica carinata]
MWTKKPEILISTRRHLIASVASGGCTLNGSKLGDTFGVVKPAEQTTFLKFSILICLTAIRNAFASGSSGVFVALIEHDPYRCWVSSLLYKDHPTPATSFASFHEAST